MKERISEIPVVAQASTQSPPAALSGEELDRLVDDPVAIRRLSKRKLVELVANQPVTPSLVPVIRELMDRTDGKAPQYIHQVNENVSRLKVSEYTTAQLIAELRKMDLPDGVALLEDGSVVIDN